MACGEAPDVEGRKRDTRSCCWASTERLQKRARVCIKMKRDEKEEY